MGFFRRLKKQFYIYLIWIGAVIIIWPWLFRIAYDAPRNKKIVMYVRIYDYKDPELAAAMEDGMSEDEKMVKILTFDDGSNHEDKFSTADLYIAASGDLYTIGNWVLPLTELQKKHPEYEYYTVDGVPYGVEIYDYPNKTAVMNDYIYYRVSEENLKLGNNLTTSPNYYIFVGALSPHSGEPGSINDDALKVLEHMMTLP